MSRLRTRALLLVATAALACAGCGPEVEPLVGVSVQRIVPEIPRGVVPVGAEVVVERLRVPEGLEPWSVESPRVEVGPVPGFDPEVTPDAVMMWGQPRKRVLIPGSFDPREFDEVRLTLLTRVSTNVAVNLLRNGETVYASGWIEVTESAEPQPVVARFPFNPGRSEPYDALEILVAPGAAGPVCLFELQLAQVPFRRWVVGEDPGTERLVRIGDEFRRAVGLADDLPRSASFLAESGAHARFSFGLDPQLRQPGAEPALRVTLTAAGVEPRVEQMPLEALGSRAPRWHTADLEFGAFAGRQVELRFELIDAKERKAGDESIGVYGYVGGLRVQKSEARPRTVLLVTSDTHRADHIGAARDSVAVETPAIDALAERGVLFERALSTTNVTLPSHVALLTGIHPRDTRIVDNRTPLSEQALTLAEVFREQRFRTWAVVSANHLSPERSGLGQGFERVSAPRESQRAADATLSDLLRWLPDAEGEPLFVWVHLFDAHTPYEPPGAFGEAYDAQPMGMATDGSKLAALPDEVRLERERYRGEVSYLDLELGRLLELPRFRDGLVALTADHGECLGQHEVYYDHAGLYPDSVHVPLIIAWPDAPAGTRVERWVQHLGLGRTLLELTGLEDPAFPGRSLVGLDAVPNDDPIFTLAYAGTSASITRGDLHLILHLVQHEVDKGGEVREHALHELELYDLAADPACDRELSGERPVEARALREALVRWLTSAHSSGLARSSAADPAFQAELEGLGYVEGVGAGSGDWFDPECECDGCADY